MKSIYMLAGAGALSMLLSGCAPELDQTQLSPEEQAWAANFKANYSAWQPPESVPRSVRRDDIPQQDAANQNTIPAAADTVAPAVVEEPAAASPAPVADTTAAPAPAPAPVADNATAAAAATEEPAAAAAESYMVVKGDTLGAIAQKMYGKASAWKKIADANADLLKGKTIIRPGMKLVIPRP